MEEQLQLLHNNKLQVDNLVGVSLWIPYAPHTYFHISIIVYHV